MIRQRICNTILLLLLCIKCVTAQQYHFKNYTVADGLGSTTVNHIFQDSRGYIWFATQGGGVSRFNGKEFKTYTHIQGLISNDVTNIAEDERGHIWIATANGASEFNGVSFTNYGLKEGLTDGVVYAVCAARGKVWFATEDKGVKIWKGGKGFDSLTVKDGLPSNQVFSIVEALSGAIIIGLGNGIASYSNGKIRLLTSGDKTFFSAYAASNGLVWMGTTGGEVVSVNTQGEIKNLVLPPALQHDFIGSIAGDKQNNLWIGTDHGLLNFNGHSFTLLGEREGLSINAVQAAMVDYEGNVWCGTLGGGVNLLTSRAFALYSLQQGLNSRNVNCIYPMPGTDKYYAGTAERLYVLNTADSLPLQPVEGIKQLHKVNITTLATDSSNTLWVGTQNGVYTLAKGSKGFVVKREYKELQHIKLTSVQKVLCAPGGDVWIATYGSGVFLISPKGVKCFNTGTGLASDNILTMHRCKDGSILLGTQNDGLFKYNGETFMPVPLAGPKPNTGIWAIAEGDGGKLFIGTGENGLCVLNNGHVKNYTTVQGLTSDYITALAWDATAKCLWAGSEKGLDKIEWTKADEPAKVYNYKPQDGFNARGINQNGIIIRNNKDVWICGPDGLWNFKYELQATHSQPPQICIENIRLFYKPANWQNMGYAVDTVSGLPVNLELPYYKNHLTFDIQALSALPMHYTFMLQGQDGAWSVPAQNNTITYSNLSPGKYTFMVKAVTRNGVTSTGATKFMFTIKPPWWKTWWFYMLAFIAIISALSVFIKARERILKQQNLKLEETILQRTKIIAEQKLVVENTLKEKEGLLRDKEVLLKEIHHRVKNNLQTISSLLMLQSAGLQDEQAKKAIAESQNRVRSIALVHQKLYQTDGIEKIELQSFARELAAQVAAVYKGSIKPPTLQLDIPELYISIDTAIPLGLILNELLTNSFKYAFSNTDKGYISITVSINKNAVETGVSSKKAIMVYLDNGPGLPSEGLLQNAGTLGLRLIKLLAKQIGASLSYSNKAGSEFKFEFTIF